jgi:1,2-diacylglycerol 3-beta-galactosyltransferase
VKRVLFLMSDTGGGHRAAAEAIRDAMFERYGEANVQAEMVDVYRNMRFPANTMPEFYPWIVNNTKWLWALVYRLSERSSNARLTSSITYHYNRSKLRRMIRKHPADVVVCVHSVTAQPVMSAYCSFPERPPFLTVVTDLVTTPIFWYDPRVDRCLVPTEPALERGLKYGLAREQLRVTGLPVHPRFERALMEKDDAREELGWDANLPAVLMVAGGDGMGPLYETTRAIVEKKLKCQIAVVAGRNKTLKARLDKSAEEWRREQPIHIYGFVTNMPRLMAAADMLVTKAGPATICEACIAGLPVILSDAIPGQEDGNITYVVENNVGVYAPSPEEVADAVESWLSEGIEAVHARGERARAISKPDAVWTIADEVWEYAHRTPVKINRKKWSRRNG